jgi:hypothetical protein
MLLLLLRLLLQLPALTWLIAAESCQPLGPCVLAVVADLVLACSSSSNNSSSSSSSTFQPPMYTH